MEVYEIDTDLMSSISVARHEVCAVAMAPGEKLKVGQHRNTYTLQAENHQVVMCDRYIDGAGSCTGVRQVLPLTSDKPEGWSQLYVTPNRRAREWAKAHDCPRITVRGGIPPLTLEGQVAVPDFAMSGTHWYIVPAEDLEKLTS